MIPTSLLSGGSSTLTERIAAMLPSWTHFSQNTEYDEPLDIGKRKHDEDPPRFGAHKKQKTSPEKESPEPLLLPKKKSGRSVGLRAIATAHSRIQRKKSFSGKILHASSTAKKIMLGGLNSIAGMSWGSSTQRRNLTSSPEPSPQSSPTRPRQSTESRQSVESEVNEIGKKLTEELIASAARQEAKMADEENFANTEHSHSKSPMLSPIFNRIDFFMNEPPMYDTVMHRVSLMG